MNQDRLKGRHFSFYIFLSLILFLGLVQWSLLPLLMESGLPSVPVVLAISTGHTSTSAAPFKCLFGDFLNTCLLESNTYVPVFTASFLQRLEEPVSRQDGRFFSDRQLRAPPSL